MNRAFLSSQNHVQKFVLICGGRDRSGGCCQFQLSKAQFHLSKTKLKAQLRQALKSNDDSSCQKSSKVKLYTGIQPVMIRIQGQFGTKGHFTSWNATWTGKKVLLLIYLAQKANFGPHRLRFGVDLA
jgi:hypothetical protein